MPASIVTEKIVNGRKVITKIIQIDQVTSGKLENGIFSLCYKRKQIDTQPFSLKGPTAMYAYKHHYDQYDLISLSKKYPSFIPYHERYGLERWGDLIKYQFFNLISSGAFNRIIELDADTVILEVKWVGPTLNRPEI